MNKESENSTITDKISVMLYDLLDKVALGRENYYYNHPKPDEKSIPYIISS